MRCLVALPNILDGWFLCSIDKASQNRLTLEGIQCRRWCYWLAINSGMWLWLVFVNNNRHLTYFFSLYFACVPKLNWMPSIFICIWRVEFNVYFYFKSMWIIFSLCPYFIGIVIPESLSKISILSQKLWFLFLAKPTQNSLQ